MKTIPLTLIFILSLNASAVIQNVAVLDFTGKDVSASEATTISDYFRTELVKLHAFKVIDRQNMDKIMAEQALQTTGCTTADCAVEIGKLLNVEYMFVGTLSRFAESYILNIQQVDIESGQISHSEKGESKEMNDILKIARQLAYKFCNMKINKALPRELKNAKCPQPTKSKKVECLGTLESLDDIAEVNYSFAFCKITYLDRPRWEFKVIAGEAHISAVLEAKRAQQEARKARKERKDYFTWGSVNKPDKYDPRRVEIRCYQKKGKVTEIELILVTRDKNHKAKEMKKLKVKWPWPAEVPE